MTLEGKVCVVTGAGSGIGRATALEMTRQSARGVAVLDIDEAGGRETVRLVQELGGDAEFFRCDVRSSSQIQATMDAVAVRFVGIDVLHNNAGVHESYFSDKLEVHTLPDEAWQAVCDINLRGTWLCTKHAAPYLLRSERGPSIVNASSIGGVVGIMKDPIYGPTKAAINHLTRQTAIDLAPTVRCNAYAPASTDTPMIDKVEAGTGAALDVDRNERRKAYLAPHLIPRVGRPEEIAKLICYLASDDAAFITGAVVVIDGGVTAWRGVRSV